MPEICSVRDHLDENDGVVVAADEYLAVTKESRNQDILRI
jgi:hypothetical protein